MGFERYFKGKTVVLDCKTVTPLFLGGADQKNAEWRCAPFKALLRYWWRVTQNDLPEPTELRKRERALFGFAGDLEESESAKSPLQLQIVGKGKPVAEALGGNLKSVTHPEVRRSAGIHPLLYLGGMGLMKDKQVTRSYFPANSDFQWRIQYPASYEKEVKSILALIQAFGAIGARCRNGWGSFETSTDLVSLGWTPRLLDTCTGDWEEPFAKGVDYPNRLGRDSKGPLLWKTEEKRSWEEAMRDLSEAYIRVRASTVEGIDALNPGGNEKPSERHLLGVPLTHHSGGWKKDARHSSPLRFVVRQKGGSRWWGIVLHVPHRHSANMIRRDQIDQIRVWKKVHKKLDALLARAHYEECL